MNISDYKKSIGLIEQLYDLAGSYFLSKKFKKSFDAFDNLIDEIEKDDYLKSEYLNYYLSALTGKGYTACKLGKWSQGIEILNKVIRLEPKHIQASNYLEEINNNTFFDENGFNQLGYNKKGFSKEGYDINGFDNNKNHKDTGRYFDLKGLDIGGYDKDGFNQRGYNRLGYDRQGFDNKGWSIEGINKTTNKKYDKNGLDMRGYSKEGYNKDGKKLEPPLDLSWLKTPIDREIAENWRDL